MTERTPASTQQAEQAGSADQQAASADQQAEQARSADRQATPRTGKAPAALKVHHLRPAPGAHTRKTRVGRGQGSKGKTAGRGTKGTKARYQVPAHFEGGQIPIHMRVPNLRGFKNRFRVEYQVVNLDRLSQLYPEGGQVGVDELVAKGAVRDSLPVKILGDGEISVALDITADCCSASARAKIEQAGGSITLR